MAELLLGTSSWSAPGWVGPFYAEGTRPADFLREYAQAFGTVEADVTYYRVPSAAMVDGWRERTPPDFVIAAKFPRSVVHAGAGPRPDPGALLVPERCGEDTARFLDVMDRLEHKAGPLVLQFPYFNRSVFPARAPFLERLEAFLAELPGRFRYAVELRNERWLDEQLTALLARHDVALVLVDLAYMPHPADLARRLDLVTTDFVYGRLIGDRQQVEAHTTDFDRIVLDQGPRLQRWAELVGALEQRVDKLYLYANNHYAGHGPATIRQLGALLGADGV